MLGIVLGLFALLVGSGLIALAVFFPNYLRREFQRHVAEHFVRGPLIEVGGGTGTSFRSSSSLEVERAYLSTILNVEKVLLRWASTLVPGLRRSLRSRVLSFAARPFVFR